MKKTIENFICEVQIYMGLNSLAGCRGLATDQSFGTFTIVTELLKLSDSTQSTLHHDIILNLSISKRK